MLVTGHKPPQFHLQLVWLPALLCLLATAGCSLVPDVRHKPQYLNPFPQIRTVAVLPFVNQSKEPTLSGERVAAAYISELQAIRGFEVVPLGAVQIKMREFQRPLGSGEDFQAFAQYLGVDVVIIGSVTDYDAYYPPRMTMNVNWYAANPGFHPILPGYGLPWGTKEEKRIPSWIHQEAQRALATEQLKTQAPEMPVTALNTTPVPARLPMPERKPVPVPVPGPAVPGLQPSAAEPSAPDFPETLQPSTEHSQPPMMPEDRQLPDATEELPAGTVLSASAVVVIDDGLHGGVDPQLPGDWPDPRGFIPDAPVPTRPPMLAQHEPIISYMRSFNGHDEDFTEQLADYFYFRDDARFGGWQAYLQRSEDFIRFCCHLHVTETLASRGGQDKSRLIFRWPIDRYSR